MGVLDPENVQGLASKPGALGAACLGTVILYVVSWMIYNLYFHPLASFPGPWLARSSLLWRVWHTTSGRIHLAIDEQHKRYGKPHFWQELILEHLFFVTVLDNLRRYPIVARIGKLLLPRFTVAIRDKHSGYSRDKVARRLAAESTRKDFLSTLVSKVQAGELDREELTAHSSTLVIAGGETVATFLAAVTYFLLRTPAAYDKLRAEIRGRYATAADIDALTAQQLPYLMAVIAEGLRLYPPGSQGFPRISPGAVVDGVWVPRGAECYTSAWSPTHDEAYFHDPFAFKPERWLDPNCTDVKEASQPFSLGPRGCLGRNFAYVEMSLTLATLHFRYDLELVDDKLDWLQSSRVHVMWWKPELRVRFKERN
ncbi:Cytochrome P450 [Lasiodiplodia theobromae]|nr:Cytochrome P450 [Lasiodiplodia theobromae]